MSHITFSAFPISTWSQNEDIKFYFIFLAKGAQINNLEVHQKALLLGKPDAEKFNESGTYTNS